MLILVCQLGLQITICSKKARLSVSCLHAHRQPRCPSLAPFGSLAVFTHQLGSSHLLSPLQHRCSVLSRLTATAAATSSRVAYPHLPSCLHTRASCPVASKAPQALPHHILCRVWQDEGEEKAQFDTRMVRCSVWDLSDVGFAGEGCGVAGAAPWGSGSWFLVLPAAPTARQLQASTSSAHTKQCFQLMAWASAGSWAFSLWELCQQQQQLNLHWEVPAVNHVGFCKASIMSVKVGHQCEQPGCAPSNLVGGGVPVPTDPHAASRGAVLCPIPACRPC